MQKIVTFVICLIAVLAAASSAFGFATARLVRDASLATGLTQRGPVRIATSSRAGLDRRALVTLDATAPRLLVRYESGFLAAFALPGSLASERASATRGASALYDPRPRTVYRLRSARRAAVLREAVRALEDQHVGFRRLSVRLRDRDAYAAATATLDGTAAFVAGTGVPLLPAGPPLRRFVGAERSLGLRAGRRLASELRYLGGRRAMRSALSPLPKTTEQVLHLDKFLEREPAVQVALPARAAGAELAATGAFGELDVRALLEAFRIHGGAAAAEGWGGGASAAYVGPEGATSYAIVLAWDRPEDAAEWAAAVSAYVVAAYPGAQQVCLLTPCWAAGPRGLAFDREGSRTALVVAPSLAPATTLAAELAGRG